jgi:hypothetical protein
MLGATEWLSAVPPRDHIAAPPIPPKSAMSPSGTTRPAADTLVPLPARPRSRAAVFKARCPADIVEAPADLLWRLALSPLMRDIFRR